MIELRIKSAARAPARFRDHTNLDTAPTAVVVRRVCMGHGEAPSGCSRNTTARWQLVQATNLVGGAGDVDQRLTHSLLSQSTTGPFMESTQHSR